MDPSTLISLGLSVLPLIYPPAAPIAAIIVKFMPAIIAAIPAIKQAVADGESAFEAAKTASPDFSDFVGHISPHVGSAISTTAAHPENIARIFAGLPHMTPDEERQWMDSTTAHVNDPRMGG